jgi:hypothetical protein
MDRHGDESVFNFGDRVQHHSRPEWGAGTVTRVQWQTTGSARHQRLTIRFENAGIKTLSTAKARLERLPDAVNTIIEIDVPTTMEQIDRMIAQEGLTKLAQRRLRGLMERLPDDVQDPFRPASARLKDMLSLFRFTRSGRGLIDWAVAQTKLADPLSRFNRHELEQYFDRWAAIRNAYLVRLINELDLPEATRQQLVDQGPPAARDVLRHPNTMNV